MTCQTPRGYNATPGHQEDENNGANAGDDAMVNKSEQKQPPNNKGKGETEEVIEVASNDEEPVIRDVEFLCAAVRSGFDTAGTVTTVKIKKEMLTEAEKRELDKWRKQTEQEDQD